MATIVYSVCGEGNGHSFRAKEVIDFLQKEGHKVHIFSYSKGYANLSKHYSVHKIAGSHIYYYHNKALALPTAILNMLRLPWMLAYNLPTIATTWKIKPDLIITDFEPWMHYLAVFLGIPRIALNNQSALLSSSTYAIPTNALYKWSSQLVVKLFEPFAHHYLCPVFYNNYLPIKKGVIYTQAIVRKKIQDLKKQQNRNQKNKNKQGKEQHILVYQTSGTNTAMLDELHKCKERFIVYGFSEEGVTGNITFRSFNDAQFYDDFTNAKAVICNGGLMFMTEALYLGKPVYAVPVQHQFEQVMNAYYLQKMQCGVAVNEFSIKTFSAFLEKSTVYKKYISRLKFDNNKTLFELLKEIIT